MGFDVSKGLTRAAAKTGSFIFKHRGDVAALAGIGVRAAGASMMVKATCENADVIRDYKPTIAAIDADLELNEDDKEYEKRVVRYSTGKKLVKAYAPGAGVYVAGELLTAYGMSTKNKEISRLSDAITASVVAAETLKAAVAKKYGEDGLNAMLYGETVKEIVDPDTGRLIETVVTREDVPDGLLAFEFNAETSSCFEQKRTINRLFFEEMIRQYQSAVDTFGEASLAHCLKDLGFPKSVYTKYVDWIWVYGQEVSFGLDKDSTDVRLFMDDEKPTVLLQFNCVRRV